jgi:hypothetical protein
MDRLVQKFLLGLIVSAFLSKSLLFAQNDLFTEVDIAKLSENQTKILNILLQEETTIELKIAKVNIANFLTIDPINLNLFPDKSFQALTERIDLRSEKNFDWYGSISEKFGTLER